MILSKEECGALCEFIAGYYQANDNERAEAAAQVIGIVDFLLAVAKRREENNG